MKNSLRKLTTILLTICICATFAVAFASCTPTSESHTVMQMDLNPSVEFILDKDNKVVSVTALNDDGAVIVSGEAFIGKTAEDAAALFVEVSTETGYLVKGEAAAADNQITVSVSGNADTAQKLYEKIETKVETAIENGGITAAVEKGEKLKTETLRATVKVCYPELTDEEISAMTDSELTEKLAESRKETQELVSAAMRESYYKAKEYNISVAENEAFGKAVSDANAAYQVIMAGYTKAVEALKAAVTDIENLQYQYLISPDSTYQKAVTAVLQAKKDVLAQKSKVAELDEGVEKTAAELILTQKETLLTSAETMLESAYNTAKTAFAAAETTVQTIMSSLETVKNSLPDDITSILTDKAT